MEAWGFPPAWKRLVSGGLSPQSGWSEAGAQGLGTHTLLLQGAQWREAGSILTGLLLYGAVHRPHAVLTLGALRWALCPAALRGTQWVAELCSFPNTYPWFSGEAGGTGAHALWGAVVPQARCLSPCLRQQARGTWRRPAGLSGLVHHISTCLGELPVHWVRDCYHASPCSHVTLSERPPPPTSCRPLSKPPPTRVPPYFIFFMASVTNWDGVFRSGLTLAGGVKAGGWKLKPRLSPHPPPRHGHLPLLAVTTLVPTSQGHWGPDCPVFEFPFALQSLDSFLNICH